jgi:hypothetical protein
LDLQARALNVDATESFRLHSEYIAKVKTFIALVADNTNATLDPELETYYLMDLFVTRLPSLPRTLVGSGPWVRGSRSVGRVPRPRGSMCMS